MRVEGLTTTPFSDRALDRGLTGVLVAASGTSDMAALPNTAAACRAAAGGRRSQPLLDSFADRAGRSSRMTSAAVQRSPASELQYRLDRWRHKRSHLQTGTWATRRAPTSPGCSRTRRRHVGALDSADEPA